MNASHITPAGRSLLDRRAFLRHTCGGLSNIALASLLAQQGRLGAEDLTPWRPQIDPSHPHAPRPAPGTPRARQVLVIFCSGAVSHVDTFDYKPELVKRHDTPMPGADGCSRQPHQATLGIQAARAVWKDDQRSHSQPR